MADDKRGRVGWVDLTVDNAETLRDFYADVMGWIPEGLEMGGYDDYVMTPSSSEEPAAGVCHRRGQNSDIPPQWIVYFVVDDVATAAAKAVQRGGKLLRPATDGGFALVRDPAGAIFALHGGEPEDDTD